MPVYGSGPYGAGYYGGERPRFGAILLVEMTTDPVSDTSPTWVDVTDQVRAFQTNRGRDSELSRVEAGTARLILNNRDRDFDPTTVTLLRPGNRWRLSDSFTGEMQFMGYATSYEMQWPSLSNVDAITIVEMVDYTKYLAISRLPVMNPAESSTYEQVVMFDEPQGFWQFQDAVDLRVMQPTTGGVIFTTGTVSRVAGAIVGDPAVENIAATLYGGRSTTTNIRTIEDLELGVPGLPVGGPFDIGGASAFTVELWFKTSEFPVASTRAIAAGPLSGGSFYQWDLTLQTSGLVRGVARNSGGTAYTVDSTSTVPTNTWVHIALVVNGSNTWLYLNGALEDTDSWTGVGGVMDAGGYAMLGTATAVGGTRFFDAPAFYRYALTSDRLIAHYEAGALRGFTEQTTGGRIDDAINAIGYGGSLSIDSGTRDMLPSFMRGQSALDEIRRAEDAEGVDGVFFISRTGVPTFLEDGHRSSSPYNTVQCTFDDDGTDLPYKAISVDYSDSFLANEITLSREGGENIVDDDATSITAYDVWPLQKSGLALVDDADVTSMAASLLTKYKAPMFRITGLTVDTSNAAVQIAVLALDIGDRIRVLHTQPDGGRIDQTLFVQRIQVAATPGVPWTISLGVSPL